MALSIVIIWSTLLTLTYTQNTSLPQLSTTFQTLLTHPPPTKNDYLKFLSSIEQLTNNQGPGTNDNKKLYNLMSAATVSKILTNLAKHQPTSQPVSQINNHIKSLEKHTITLPHYISTQTSRIKTQLTKSLTQTPLITSLSSLKSTLDTSTPSTTLQKEPQLATISLLQIYVCATNPHQRFTDINSNFQVPSPLRFIDTPNSRSSPHQFTWPSPTCDHSLQDYQLRRFSHVAHSPIISQLISKYNDRTTNLQQAHSKFRKAAKGTPNTYENLIDYFKAASQLEQSVDTLVTQLFVEKNSPEIEDLLLQASLYELSDAEKAKKLEKAELDKVKVHFKKLRYLRSRLYDSIISIFEESLDILNGNVNDGISNDDIITDTLAAISDSTRGDLIDDSLIQSAKTHQSTLTQLKYYQHFSQLSDLMTNINSPFGSKTEIHDPHLKALATLSDQVIKSSLLQIEYDHLSKRLTEQSGEVLPNQSKSRLKTYRFVLTESSCSPDNYVQACYVINGQHPGPPIIVNQHDLVRIHVVNRMSVNTTMHFHGILQRHTVESDGVGGVTQELIPPNGSYVYEIQVGDQAAGTYMYHGHHALDLVWLHGPLIIRDNPSSWKSLGPVYHYNQEHTFMLSAVFHESLDDVMTGIVEQGIDDPPVTSFAINGKSYGNWSDNNGNSSGYEVVNVKLGSIYRFRVINIAAGSMMVFTVDNHTLTIVEMDGIVSEPVVTDRLEIHTGQRYSVLVAMDQVPGNYWVRARVMGDEGGADNGRAVIHYNGGGDVGGMRKGVFGGVTDVVEIVGDGWVLGELMPSGRVGGVYDFPGGSDRVVLIDMQMRTVGGPPRFLVNGNVFVQPNGTFLGIVRGGGDLRGESHVVRVKGGEVVDLVFQNRVDDTGGCDEHPIHIHGHSFWVVTTGADEVNMTDLERTLEGESLRGNRREFRDTWTLFPNSSVESSVSGTACGWGVLRFVADNPGMWLVHCHVTSHMILGKQFVIYEYVDGNEGLFNE